MSRRPLLLLALLALAPAGCGNERTSAPAVGVEPSEETKTLDYARVGLSLELPRDFSVEKSKQPGVFRATFGSAAVSAFAYRRREELPGNEKDLKKALKRLEKATMKRSSTFELISSRTLDVNGSRALELVGRQTISQSRLRTRSLHVFEGKAEYVIELLAPVRQFDRLDERLSDVIRNSLEITGKVPSADAGGRQRGAVPPSGAIA